MYNDAELVLSSVVAKNSKAVFSAEVYHDGIVRLSLMREDIPITKRIRAGFMVNTDKEFMVDLRYIINRNMGIRTHYDSDMGFGVGLTLNY